MINLDKLAELKFEHISPALNRKKWDLPMRYSLEHLGGYYDNPGLWLSDDPVGIVQYFGKKTGNAIPVTLDFTSTKGVVKPGAIHITHEFFKPAADRANELCGLLGLPAIIAKPATNPREFWQAAFPADKVQIFRNIVGFTLTVEGKTSLLSLWISNVPPLAEPRYEHATLYDLNGVTKNCSKRYLKEVLDQLRKPGTLLPNEMLDNADFVPDAALTQRVWRFPVSNRLRDFKLVVPEIPDDTWVASALELLHFVERDEFMEEIVYGDYRRHELNHPEKLSAAAVPEGLRKGSMKKYITDRRLVVVADGKDSIGRAQVQTQWSKSPLVLGYRDGKIVTVDGQKFKIDDEVLTRERDSKSKPRPAGKPTAEFKAQLNAVKMITRLMPIQIEKTKAPKPMPASLKKLVLKAEAAGFIKLGWLEVMMPMPLTLAAFTNDDGVLLSISTSMLLDKEVVDCTSHLDGNRKLTTTTLETVMPQPERGIFKYSHPKADIAGLLKKHQAYLKEMNGTPTVRVKTLEEFEQSIRDYLAYESQP